MNQSSSKFELNLTDGSKVMIYFVLWYGFWSHQNTLSLTVCNSPRIRATTLVQVSLLEDKGWSVEWCCFCEDWSGGCCAVAAFLFSVWLVVCGVNFCSLYSNVYTFLLDMYFGINVIFTYSIKHK